MAQVLLLFCSKSAKSSLSQPVLVVVVIEIGFDALSIAVEFVLFVDELVTVVDFEVEV